MRLDTDSRISSKVKYDMFAAMDKYSYKYGYVTLVTDNRHYTEGLWNLTTTFVESNQLTPTWSNGWKLSKDGNTRGAMFSFYNNFEIVNLPWFRQKKVFDYARVVDTAGGIYRTRWGDATIRFLQLAMFGGPELVRGFCDAFIYRHDNRAITQASCHVRSRGKCGCNGMLMEVAHPQSEIKQLT
jgi:hypothetical protein